MCVFLFPFLHAIWGSIYVHMIQWFYLLKMKRKCTFYLLHTIFFPQIRAFFLLSVQFCHVATEVISRLHCLIFFSCPQLFWFLSLSQHSVQCQVALKPDNDSKLCRRHTPIKSYNRWIIHNYCTEIFVCSQWVVTTLWKSWVMPPHSILCIYVESGFLGIRVRIKFTIIHSLFKTRL